MQSAIQYVLSGLAIGGIYALVALGFHIMWSAARAVNFAHGDTLMLGAVLAIMGVDAGLAASRRRLVVDRGLLCVRAAA